MKFSFKTATLYLFLLSVGLYAFGLEFYYIINSGSPLYNVEYLAVYNSKGQRLNLDRPIVVLPNDILTINRLACSTSNVDVTISKELIGPINTSSPPFAVELPSVDMDLQKGCQQMRAFFKVPPDTISGEYNYFTDIKVTPVPLLTIKQPLPQINLTVINSNPLVNTTVNNKLP